ncbi:HNH endonuclease family protein [Actinophytocola sp.]|uniref:HNH endonuclease family protein n=1 Tax=Actinophytocola sp. TaxID=1872138 RepID=UPI003899F554
MLRRALPVLPLLLLVALTGCQNLPLGTQPSSVAPPPATLPPGALADQLAALQIAVEDTGAHYKREDWLEDWARSGECTTRETVLKQQGQNVVVNDRCAPTSGTWVSSYDGVTVTNPSKLDIDHVVPLAEVARSGPVVNGLRQRPGDWPVEQRHAYANDIEGLVAVTASSNRSKGDDDPAKWLPALDHCGYIARWLHMKTKYKLSVDQQEHDAIAQVISTCPA